jgi:hypothetical protein
MRRKNVVQTTTNTIINADTGEILENHESKTTSKEVEPDFVKLYLADISRLHDLPPYVSKLLYSLCRSMGYRNIVPMYKPIKEFICRDIGISLNSLNKSVDTLRKLGILIPVGGGRGLYIMDPNLFGRGKWEEVKELRLAITYTGGKRKITGYVEKQLEMEFTSMGKNFLDDK